MNKAKLQEAMKLAMKAKDKLRLDTIRGLLSAIQYEEMEKKVEELAPDAIVATIQREVKRRREELEFAEKANRLELVDKFKTEIAVLEGFLPSQLSVTDLEKVITDLKGSTPGLNVGGVMKHLKEKYSGQFDSKLASELCRKMLG